MTTIAQTRVNDRYLKDIPLPSNITVTSSPKDALSNADAVFIVIPAQFLRTTLPLFTSFIPSSAPLVLCSKGIELSSGLLVSDVVQSFFPHHPLAVLSGPNFAREVALGLPAASVIACKDVAIAEKLANTLASPSFRPYLSRDVIGAEVAGALKNVIAIASGIVMGMKLGDNARAALITRGLAEIKKLGLALGADADSFSGLSGMGDLLLTATSHQSRNFALGFALGEGQSLKSLTQNSKSVHEGVATSAALIDLAQKHHLNLPICQTIHDVLYLNMPLTDAVQSLMSRPVTEE
jgi:glycerol-3-phosphate dehydrogenase (NAD(P)+)